MHAMKCRTARFLPLFAMVLGACGTGGATVPTSPAPTTRAFANDGEVVSIQRAKVARLHAKLLDPAAGETAAIERAKATRLREKLLSRPGVLRDGEAAPTR